MLTKSKKRTPSWKKFKFTAKVLKMRKLGAGSYGVALDAGNGLCLKITSNSTEFEYAQIMQGHKIPGVWNIYATGYVPSSLEEEVRGEWEDEFWDSGTYWILGEKLYPLVDNSDTEYPEESWTSEFYRKADEVAAKVGDYLMEKFDISHEDGHYGNLLKTKRGVFKFVDVM